MKVLILALALVVLVAGGVVGNCIYIKEVTDHLQDLLFQVEQTGLEAFAEINSFIAYWEKHHGTVGLSVSYTVTDRVTEQAAVLKACASCKDSYGFSSALALLKDAVDDVRRLEQIRLENLL